MPIRFCRKHVATAWICGLYGPIFGVRSKNAFDGINLH